MFWESGSAIHTHFPGQAVAQKMVVEESLSLLQLREKNPAIVFSFSFLCCLQKYKV